MLKGTLIGAGYFAGFQAEAWERISAATITAVADPIPDKAQRFAENHRIPRAYASVEEMLDREQPDFVDIATRPESHLALATAAAERRVHVICQKPMAPTWADCIAMCEVCERNGVRLFIHENWRWQPWYREIKNLVGRGLAGKPYQIAFQWRTGDGRGPEPYPAQPYFRHMPRLLIYESLVHLLDTFRFLIGEVSSVYCQNRRINPVISGEDQSLIELVFKDGTVGLIDANRVSGPVPAPVAMGSLTVEGTDAVLRVAPDGRISICRHGQSETEHKYSPPMSGYKGDSVYATQQHLIDSLNRGVPSESDGRGYLATVALVEACYQSAATGEAVQVFV